MRAQTMTDALRARVNSAPERVAYTFLEGMRLEPHSITWSKLDQRATQLANHMRGIGVANEPVLLALHSGLQFIESLFACWYAGAIPVPINLPRHQQFNQRLSAITSDSQARFAIGTARTRALLAPAKVEAGAAAGLTWIDVENPEISSATSERTYTHTTNLALLQYTSGSTGSPRGVMVTHSNLLHNSAMIASACGHTSDDVIAAWLPLFHDMGLIGFVVQTVFVGMQCILMPPERFLMSPWAWLRVMSDYHATGTAAPNFAYDLCVDRVGAEHKASLDLSAWRNAMNGSEPIRAATLDRFAAAFECCGFRRSAFSLCYGLAEATLFVTGPTSNRIMSRRSSDGALLSDAEAGGHVGCGIPFPGTRLTVVDPDTHAKVPAGTIGEIWVSGESVTQGYWNNTEATAATFKGRLQAPSAGGESVILESEETSIDWLRTGDLGFIDQQGELFVTGRLRELIIIGGRNHFPADIEYTVEAADPCLAASSSVAFSVDCEGVEQLIVCAEIRREFLRAAGGAAGHVDFAAVRQKITRAVAAENDIAPRAVLLLRPGTIPRTSSGKLRRLAAREAYLNQSMDQLDYPSNERATVRSAR